MLPSKYLCGAPSYRSSPLLTAACTHAAGRDKLWVATVMPGYDDTRLGRPDGFRADRHAGAYDRRMWQGAIATRPTIVSTCD